MENFDKSIHLEYSAAASLPPSLSDIQQTQKPSIIVDFIYFPFPFSLSCSATF